MKKVRCLELPPVKEIIRQRSIVVELSKNIKSLSDIKHFVKKHPFVKDIEKLAEEYMKDVEYIEYSYKNIMFYVRGDGVFIPDKYFLLFARKFIENDSRKIYEEYDCFSVYSSEEVILKNIKESIKYGYLTKI